MMLADHKHQIIPNHHFAQRLTPGINCRGSSLYLGFIAVYSFSFQILINATVPAAIILSAIHIGRCEGSDVSTVVRAVLFVVTVR